MPNVPLSSSTFKTTGYINIIELSYVEYIGSYNFELFDCE